NTYSKIISINTNKSKTNPTIKTLNCVSYTGSGKTIHPIKDFLLGQTTIPVVVNIMSGLNLMNGSINPMMLMILNGNEGEESSSIETLMMMSMMQLMGGGNAGNVMNGMFNNPMMMLLMDKGNSEGGMMEKMMMMQMMSGGENYGVNLFGNQNNS